MQPPEINGPEATVTPTAEPIQQSIHNGLIALAINQPEAVAPLAAFVALLVRWNRVYNLTSVRRPEDMVFRHILDSVAVLPWLHGPRVLDVGSGAGLPGIPLAILQPACTFWLLDSNGKRTRFMQQAVVELGLTNVQVVQARIEAYQPAAPFDSILSRAFATLADMLHAAGPLCAPGGRLLALKGVHPDDELAAVPADYAVRGVHRLIVPGLAAERHVVHLAPVGTQALRIQ